MKFIIRDDDTCALTQVGDLISCYKDIWPGIPVCLSVTPFMIPGYSYFKKFPKSYDKAIPYPLESNSELVGFLKEGIKKNFIDIAMHGYHHWVTNYKKKGGDKSFAPWREYLYESNLMEKTHKGKSYLEKILNTEINTFVPPGNDISKKGIESIYKNKLNLVSAPSLWRFNRRPFSLKVYQIAFKKYKWKILHEFQKFPFVIDLNTHKEISCYSLYPSTNLSELKKELDFCYSVNGVFILSTHYHAFYKKIKSGQTVEYALHSIIEYVNKKNNIEFIRYKELW